MGVKKNISQSKNVSRRRFVIFIGVFIFLLFQVFYWKKFISDSSYKQNVFIDVKHNISFPRMSKYPPNVRPLFKSQKYFSLHKKFSIECSNKEVFFTTKYETLFHHLSQWKDFPLDHLPIANNKDTWMLPILHNIIQNNKHKDHIQSQTKLAIIIPIRDRCDQVIHVVPFLHHFLQNHFDDYRIFVIEHSKMDKKVFNKGAIMNVGYVLSNIESNFFGRENFDYYIFHDVDSFVIHEQNAMSYSPFYVHRCVGRNLLQRDEFVNVGDGYFGGILQVSDDVFKTINGYSNSFFGWGLEDEDFANRLLVYHYGNIKGVYNNIGYYQRVPEDFGNVWQFPESTGRTEIHKNITNDHWKYRKYYLKNINQMEFFDHFVRKLKYLHGSYVFAKIIQRNNGFTTIQNKFKVVKSKVNEFVSYYSVVLNFEENEARSWTLNILKTHKLTMIKWRIENIYYSLKTYLNFNRAVGEIRNDFYDGIENGFGMSNIYVVINLFIVFPLICFIPKCICCCSVFCIFCIKRDLRYYYNKKY